MKSALYLVLLRPLSTSTHTAGHHDIARKRLWSGKVHNDCMIVVILIEVFLLARDVARIDPVYTAERGSVWNLLAAQGPRPKAYLRWGKCILSRIQNQPDRANQK